MSRETTQRLSAEVELFMRSVLKCHTQPLIKLGMPPLFS